MSTLLEYTYIFNYDDNKKGNFALLEQNRMQKEKIRENEQ
jgi:hypothetical protein